MQGKFFIFLTTLSHLQLRNYFILSLLPHQSPTLPSMPTFITPTLFSLFIILLQAHIPNDCFFSLLPTPLKFHNYQDNSQPAKKIPSYAIHIDQTMGIQIALATTCSFSMDEQFA